GSRGERRRLDSRPRRAWADRRAGPADRGPAAAGTQQRGRERPLPAQPDPKPRRARTPLTP
ncbi:MAG: hypothetical protein ACREYF_08390, partial [Gammaproteobacteria bacterium]